MDIPAKTWEDLEYDKILHEVEKYAYTERVKKAILHLKPFDSPAKMKLRLKVTDEFLSSLQDENRFPFGEYEDIGEDLKKLDVENIQLPAATFLAIKNQALQIKELQSFIDKFQEYYPTFYKLSQKINYESQIVKIIQTVFDKHGEIKDNASPRLKELRKKLKTTQQNLSTKFNGTMKHYNEFLADIRESVLDNKRVLAINAVHRRKVPGRFVGTSKTGSIAFVEPESVLKIQRELEELQDDEKNEVRKILRELTAEIASFQPELLQYQQFLFQLDLISAQAKFALEIDACLPKINKENRLNLINAYHPLLWIKHKAEQKPIIPQTVNMNENQRLVVISGPNAGGKSITLKTIGLLQLMLQSGLLVPVHEKSEMCFFEKIFTDIGDNQSIENQLSTYSYRLRQMEYFLKNTDENTLLLIDEFGTGSDPELGGALAEVFLEEFYEKQAFGIFTTHYTNIKVLVEQLNAALNACMLFDEKTLEPLYVLEIGQAGSSFTFEVAQKNKIPFRILNRAKKKIERNKIRLDKTILKLQQEKFNVQKTKNELKDIKAQSTEKVNRLEETHEKIQTKLVDFQRLYENEQKLLQIGRKIDEMADVYKKNRSRKKLIANFLKLIETENSKKTEKHFVEKKKKKSTQNKLKKELSKNAEKIGEIQEQIAQKEKAETAQKIASLKIGDRVRIVGSSSVGTVDKIENEKITINYGRFTTQISIFEIERI